MRRALANVYRLGVKELYSLAHDPVLPLLILYAFTFAVYTAATSETVDIRNAAIAIVDEDDSVLSRGIADAFLPPYFQRPELIALAEVDPAMDAGRFTFVLDVPPDFAADVLKGERPSLQLLVDATAMSQAGRGAGYVQSIVGDEVERYATPGTRADAAPARLAVRVRFNQNLDSAWFSGVMEVVNNVTLLAIILTGAAVIREREHGTLEHLLVMPVRPIEIMLSKIAASTLVVVAGAVLSLLIVVRALLGVPLAGSIGHHLPHDPAFAVFAFGAALYVAAISAFGILLSTAARSMPQFALLSIPAFMILNLLSGAFTPLESIPTALRVVMTFFPSMHFVEFSKGVLFRGAEAGSVLLELAMIASTGAVFFLGSLARFRASVATRET